MVTSADALKLQLAEAGIHEAVVEILLRLQDSSKPEDMCSLKAASDLIVALLLGGKNKHVKGGSLDA